MRPKASAGTRSRSPAVMPTLSAVMSCSAAPAVAQGGVSMTVRDVALHGGSRMLASTAPVEFDLVGLHWRGSGSVEFRTRSLAGRWSGWEAAAPEAEDLPDAFTQEALGAQGWRLGNPYWTGPSNRIAYRVYGRVTQLRAYFIHSPEERVPMRRLSIAGSPPIVTRRAWNANEAIRRGVPALRVGGAVRRRPSHRRLELVHRFAVGGDRARHRGLPRARERLERHRLQLSRRQVRPGVRRPVRRCRAQRDRCARRGLQHRLGRCGDARDVRNGYASGRGSDALTNLLAWRLDVAHVDPLSTVAWSSGGNARFPEGVPVTLRAVSGHRDTGFTTCPGNAFYAQLRSIAQATSAVGLPKLFAPSVRGDIGGQVRFRARLSEALPGP